MKSRRWEKVGPTLSSYRHFQYPKRSMTIILTDSSRQQQQQQQGTTAWQAFIHLLKGYVGPGCLSLPWAISQLGVPLGVIVVFVVSYWTSMNIWNVVELKRAYEKSLLPNRTTRRHPITYPDVGCWLYGRRFAKLLTAMICVQQIAVCTVFLSFIGENLGAAIRHSIGNISHTLVITMVLPAAIALTCLPNLKVLAPVMSLATMTLFAGFSVLTVLVVQQWPDRPQPYPTEIQQWGNVPLAICAVLYSFEGICLILPIETSMADGTQFEKVFIGAMTASAIIFALVGALCVVAFGPISSGSITAYLLEQADGDGDLEMLFMANTLLSVAVLLTYPLQLFPSYELVGPLLAKHFSANIIATAEDDDGDGESGSISMHHVGTHNGYLAASSDDGGAVAAPPNVDEAPFSDEEPLATQSNEETTSADNEEYDYWHYFGTSYGDTPAVRAGLVLVTYLFAIVVPNVQLLVSLAGAVSGSATGLLVPPLLQLAHLKQTERQEALDQAENDYETPGYGSWYYQRRRMECYVLLLLGCIVLIIGTTASLRDIVLAYIGLDDN